MSSIRENPSSIEQINHLIRSRRSVFPDQFEKDSTIPEDIIWQLLENANWAPNHKQTDPWRFVVFSGEGRKKIASFQSPPYTHPPVDKFSHHKYHQLLPNPLLSSPL